MILVTKIFDQARARACVYVCVFIELRITAQSGPDILVILCMCVCVYGGGGLCAYIFIKLQITAHPPLLS